MTIREFHDALDILENRGQGRHFSPEDKDLQINNALVDLWNQEVKKFELTQIISDTLGFYKTPRDYQLGDGLNRLVLTNIEFTAVDPVDNTLAILEPWRQDGNGLQWTNESDGTNVGGLAQAGLTGTDPTSRYLYQQQSFQAAVEYIFKVEMKITTTSITPIEVEIGWADTPVSDPTSKRQIVSKTTLPALGGTISLNIKITAAQNWQAVYVVHRTSDASSQMHLSSLDSYSVEEIVGNDGFVVLPSDYFTLSFARYNNLEGNNVRITMLKDSEWTIRENSKLLPPTSEFPIARIIGGTSTRPGFTGRAQGFEFRPKDQASQITIEYLRKPVTAKLDYAIVNQVVIPSNNLAANVPVDYPELKHTELLMKAAQYLGIALRDKILIDSPIIKKASNAP